MSAECQISNNDAIHTGKMNKVPKRESGFTGHSLNARRLSWLMTINAIANPPKTTTVTIIRRGEISGRVR